MRGCRPLTTEETQRVVRAFAGRTARRDRSMFVLQLTTGVRISELLSLNRGDVLTADGSLVDQVLIRRRNTKGAEAGLRKSLLPIAGEALSRWLEEQKNPPWGQVIASVPLFTTFTGRRLSRQHAYNIYRRAYRQAGLTLNALGTHTPRKTYGNRLYEAYLERMQRGENIDPFRATSRMLAHKSIDSTEAYLAFREEQAQQSLPAVVEGIEL